METVVYYYMIQKFMVYIFI